MTQDQFQAIMARLDRMDERFAKIDAHDQEFKQQINTRFDRLDHAIVLVANQVPMRHEARQEIVTLLGAAA